MQTINVATPVGEIGVPVKMNREAVTKCLVKITRGLLAHFYPNIDSSDASMEFDVDCLNSFALTGISSIHLERHLFAMNAVTANSSSGEV